jgi:hypothetical protein
MQGQLFLFLGAVVTVADLAVSISVFLCSDHSDFLGLSCLPHLEHLDMCLQQLFCPNCLEQL